MQHTSQLESMLYQRVRQFWKRSPTNFRGLAANHRCIRLGHCLKSLYARHVNLTYGPAAFPTRIGRCSGMPSLSLISVACGTQVGLTLMPWLVLRVVTVNGSHLGTTQLDAHGGRISEVLAIGSILEPVMPIRSS